MKRKSKLLRKQGASNLQSMGSLDKGDKIKRIMGFRFEKVTDEKMLKCEWE